MGARAQMQKIEYLNNSNEYGLIDNKNRSNESREPQKESLLREIHP